LLEKSLEISLPIIFKLFSFLGKFNDVKIESKLGRLPTIQNKLLSLIKYGKFFYMYSNALPS
jgi:hypothetical protein